VISPEYEAGVLNTTRDLQNMKKECHTSQGICPEYEAGVSHITRDISRILSRSATHHKGYLNNMK
jgi:hypothetical protein